MTMLEFIIFFILLTFVSSFFIVGFYGITRNYIVVQPNGKETTEGYIGKHWSMFWERVLYYDKIYYIRDGLTHKLSELNKMLPVIRNKFKESGNEMLSLIPTKDSIITEDDLFKIETVLSCKIIKKDKGEFGEHPYYFLYIEEPVYLFPSIIRKPLSQCVTCMSSVFGTAIWIFVNSLYNPFTWADNYYLAFGGFLVIFVITLSFTNDLIFRKTV